MKLHKGCQIYSMCDDQMMTFNISTQDVTKLFLTASDIPSEMVLEGFYKSKLQDSVQRQTVLGMYEQETVRNNGQTSYLRLKTSVKHFVRVSRFLDMSSTTQVAKILVKS